MKILDCTHKNLILASSSSNSTHCASSIAYFEEYYTKKFKTILNKKTKTKENGPGNSE